MKDCKNCFSLLVILLFLPTICRKSPVLPLACIQGQCAQLPAPSLTQLHCRNSEKNQQNVYKTDLDGEKGEAMFISLCVPARNTVNPRTIIQQETKNYAQKWWKTMVSSASSTRQLGHWKSKPSIHPQSYIRVTLSMLRSQWMAHTYHDPHCHNS